MNEKMSKRWIQIIVLQKQEIEEKEERRLLIMEYPSNPYMIAKKTRMWLKVDRGSAR